MTRELAATTATALWLFRDEMLPFPPLTAGEELELAMGVERGDRVSKERMISSNLRLVVSIAKRYEGRRLVLPDLIQEGVLALDRAVDTFDWRRATGSPRTRPGASARPCGASTKPRAVMRPSWKR